MRSLRELHNPHAILPSVLSLLRSLLSSGPARLACPGLFLVVCRVIGSLGRSYAANAGFDLAWDLNALRMRTSSNGWNSTFAAVMRTAVYVA